MSYKLVTIYPRTSSEIKYVLRVPVAELSAVASTAGDQLFAWRDRKTRLSTQILNGHFIWQYSVIATHFGRPRVARKVTRAQDTE